MRMSISVTKQGTNALFFTLRDKNKPFISEINYLPGFKGTGYEAISGVPLNGKSLYRMPLGIEVLIGNFDPSRRMDS